MMVNLAQLISCVESLAATSKHPYVWGVIPPDKELIWGGSRARGSISRIGLSALAK